MGFRLLRHFHTQSEANCGGCICGIDIQSGGERTESTRDEVMVMVGIMVVMSETVI